MSNPKDIQFEIELKEFLYDVQASLRDMHNGGNGIRLKTPSTVTFDPSEDGAIHRRAYKSPSGYHEFYCHLKYR